jgi:CRP/FNR family cyclic AMP-dependent transcriptional regulator
MDAKDVLKTIYLFRDAEPQDLAAVAAIAEPKAYIVAEYVYQTGDISDALFVVESGTVDLVLKDRDIPVGSVATGQAFGELAFFERRERLASAFTREATHLLRLPFAELDRIFAERPQLELVFCRHVCVALARHLGTVAPDLSRRYF